MQFTDRFSDLPEYAFPRLRSLLDDVPAGGEVLHLSIGEPKHAFPAFISDILASHIHEFGRYPPNTGDEKLLEVISTWVETRYGISKIDPEKQIMVLNGTREGLYNAAIALSPAKKNGQQSAILMPNPFYQCYAVAALAAGSEPIYVSADIETEFLPDFTALSPEILNRTTVAYVCSPSNPQGAVATEKYWTDLINLAEKYDFQIFSDECYSEIYRDKAPVGALTVAHKLGANPERVLLFNSLSKRSNVPGLRSGFVVGGPNSIERLVALRNYSGAPLPLPLQRVATALWADEAHVVTNRELYKKKYNLADRIFKNTEVYHSPTAGFFLWLNVENGEETALELWKNTGIRVLPGEYLSRKNVNGMDPGEKYIRVALVAPIEKLERGLQEIRKYIN